MLHGLGCTCWESPMSLHPLSEGTAAIERMGDSIRGEHDGAVQWASTGRGEQVCEC